MYFVKVTKTNISYDIFLSLTYKVTFTSFVLFEDSFLCENRTK